MQTLKFKIFRRSHTMLPLCRLNLFYNVFMPRTLDLE